MDYKHIPTGYFDKNGKEICEGHILICHPQQYGYRLIVDVLWNNGWEFVYINDPEPFTWEMIKESNPKIIGKDGLLFCPYCDGEAEKQEICVASGAWQINCTNCYIATPWFGTEKEAFDTWNTRVKE